MADEYEIFDNEDIPEDDTTYYKKKKIHSCKTVISWVIAGFLFIMSVANFILCMMIYNKLDDLQLGAQFYFQNSTQTNPVSSPSNIIVEQVTEYNAENTETTTVVHIEIVTQSPHSSTVSNSTHSTVTSTAVETTTTTPVQSQSSLININTATAEELTALNGIGTTKAQAIVDYRKENGKFLSVEDITNVSGIGEKTFEKIKAYITVE